MQLSNIIAVLSIAMTAVQAAPNPSVLETRTATPDCSTTGSDTKVCCTLGVCLVVILSNVCTSGESYCCSVDNHPEVNSVISISGLNCLHL